MRRVSKVLVLTVFVCYAVDFTSGKVKQGENERLPIEVVLSTEKSKEASAKNSPGHAQNENKAIKLEIRSNGNNERKLDLVIAATKEVETTEKSPDRYSPLYNAEHSIPKEVRISSDRENETSDSKTSRQDSSPFYQPSDFSNNLPLEAMRQAFEQPQHMILGRNHFSPLQNLRHFEENLNRELHPQVSGHLNGMPYGMIVTQPLFASNMYHPGLDTHPRFHAESPILGGIPYSMSHPYGGVSLINTHQPMSLMHSLPVHRYPLMNNTPKSPTSDSASQHPGSLRSQTPSHLHNHSPHQEFNLHRNPEYNPVQTNLPERHVMPHPQLPEYKSHPNTFSGDRLHSTSGLRHGGSSEQDHHHFRNFQPEHTSSPQHQPQEIKHEDRHLYYTPIRENDQRSLHKTLDHSSVDSQKPREYSPLERPPVYPPRDYNQLNHMNSNAHNQLPSRLHHLPPPSSPSLRQLPSYSVVPQESLPKYLQNPTYNSHHPTRHQMPEDAKLPQHQPHLYGPLPENRGPVHQSHANNALQPGSLRPGVTMEDSLSAIHRQRLGHPDPVHRYHQHHDDIKAKLDEKQSMNYKINDLEDSSLPYSKELKKYRKASLKQSEDDLDSHASHKYVIKIG